MNRILLHSLPAAPTCLRSTRSDRVKALSGLRRCNERKSLLSDGPGQEDPSEVRRQPANRIIDIRVKALSFEGRGSLPRSWGVARTDPTVRERNPSFYVTISSDPRARQETDRLASLLACTPLSPGHFRRVASTLHLRPLPGHRLKR